MHLFDEFKKYTDELVLVDTNVVINLEKVECKDIDKEAIKKILECGITPLLTDLSFCELVIGSNKLNDYNKHNKALIDMNFMLCGSYEPLCEYLSTFDNKKMNSEKDFRCFRSKCHDLRKEVIYLLFYKLFYLYAITSICVLHENDRNYWDDAYFLLNYIYEKRNDKFNELLLSLYNEFIDDKSEAKGLIRESFNVIIIELLKVAYPQKYIIGEVDKRLVDVLNQRNFTLMVRKLKDESIFKGDDWLYKKYIVSMRKVIDINDDTPIITDGLCFIISRIIFNNANFDAHDLIDLYNICFAIGKNVRIHYYTNDYKKKWLNFIEIEKELRPEIEILFNE